MPSPALPRPARRVWIEAFLVSVVCFIAYLSLIGRPAYNTNDDIGMDMIAAGVWTDPAGSPLLVFIHPLYGWVLSGLYRLAPAHGWHGTLLLLIASLSLMGWLASILRMRGDGLLRALLWIAAAVATGLLLSNLQFTLVAAFACIGGVTLWCSILIQRADETRWSRFEASFATVLLAAGAMLRLESAWMVWGLSIPLLCGVFWLLRSSWRRPRLFIAASAAGLFLTQTSAELCYRSESWQQWKQLNHAKSEILDTKRVKWDESLFAKHGFDANDFNMLFTWQYLDAERISPAKPAAVVQEALSRNSSEAKPPAVQRPLARFFAKVVEYMQLHPLYWLLVAAWLVSAAWSRRRVAVSVLTFASAFALLYYLDVVVNRLPVRVMAGVVLSALAAQFFISSLAPQPTEHTPTKRASLWSGALAMLLALYPLHAFYLYCVQWTGQVQERERKLDAMLQTWSQHLPADAIVYSPAGAIDVRDISPLRSTKDLPLRRVLSAGWLNQSPLLDAQLATLGLDPKAVFPSLARQPAVYLAGKTNKEEMLFIMRTLKQAYRERYHLTLSYQPAENLPGLLKLVFTPITDAAPAK
ncbi:MAG: hypothetical protein IPK32_21045 [Verrucomicrobiaceae bacterium]|nr:hypothetical protein [Verrucomicrobiaceae bacterium]